MPVITPVWSDHLTKFYAKRLEILNKFEQNLNEKILSGEEFQSSADLFAKVKSAFCRIKQNKAENQHDIQKIKDDFSFCKKHLKVLADKAQTAEIKNGAMKLRNSIYKLYRMIFDGTADMQEKTAYLELPSDLFTTN